MASVGFESAIPATKRQKTYARDGAATGIGEYSVYCPITNTHKQLPTSISTVKRQTIYASIY
jgi:hypothetical protein